MKKLKPQAVIVPYMFEPNGKVEKFLKLARSPKVKKDYEEMLKELKANPENVSKKLRQVTWGKKTVDEIFEELESEKGR